MGDRANFAFKQSNGEAIVLYGHWAGYDMLANLANAVDVARDRWNDESYATRICVSQLIGHQWNQNLSWGLLVNSIGDNEHRIPMIDWSTGTFSLHEPGAWSESTEYKIKGMMDEPIFTMTLDEFVKKYSRVLV